MHGVLMRQYMNLLEEISLNAWPAHKMELYDGWLLRFSHNYTHRTNCVNPVAPSTLPLEEKVTFCEQEYRKMHTPAIFKISPLLDPSIDEYLERQGYVTEHTTEVMTMPLEHLKRVHNTGLVDLNDTITDEWISNLFRLNGTTNPTHLSIVPAMFKAIPKETIVARIEINGRMAASGLGILDRQHAGIYAVYVDENYRRKGYARAICSAILEAASHKGMTHAYLQVVKGNVNARHLYETLGFEYRYTYWFRSKPMI